MVTIKEITDKKTWEEFILHTYSGSYPFFQSWSWGKVQKKMGFSIFRLGLLENNQLVGITQITEITAKRGHYLHLRHGPVLIDFKKYFDPLLTHIIDLTKKQKASFIRISPQITEAKVPVSFFQKRGFRSAPIHNMDAEMCLLLDITKSEDELLKAMRKSHRYLIKKAKTYDIEVITSNNPKDSEEFINLYKSFSSQKKFVAHTGIREEIEVLGKADEALFFFARYEGKIISGVLIDFIGSMAIYHHAASDLQYKHIPANYLLLWEAIREAKRRGKTYFNLFGVAPEGAKNHPWSGFTLFKTGFGGERTEYIHAMDLPLSPLYWKTYMIDLITKVKKGY